jgi:SAM-dependent methyltransferase
MLLKHYVSRLKGRISLLIFKFRNLKKEKFECPVCGYSGPFKDLAPPTGLRKHAQCPNCNALERHRIQFVVVNDVLRDRNTTHLKMLHFAPEAYFREFFTGRFGQYETADLSMKGVDHNVDLQNLPFADESFDFIFASHVLEHIPNDEKAISEIRRVLKPNGIAILPVPIVAERTIEYPEPNPYEDNHVRAPGIDYFERYDCHFSRVERTSSDSLPEKYQLYVFENRSQWPTKECPLRPSMQGEKHVDIVPVCYV